MAERARGLPFTLDVRKPPPPPQPEPSQPETLESKIDPERKKLLESLTPEELIYAFHRLKAKHKPAQAQEEEEHSDLFKHVSALFGLMERRSFRPDEFYELAEKYSMMGLTVRRPEEVGLEGSPLVQKKPQENPLGGLLTTRLLGIAETAIRNLTSSQKVQNAIANFLNTLAEMGKEEKP